jgi:hypothetical protein
LRIAARAFGFYLPQMGTLSELGYTSVAGVGGTERKVDGST